MRWALLLIRLGAVAHQSGVRAAADKDIIGCAAPPCPLLHLLPLLPLLPSAKRLRERQ